MSLKPKVDHRLPDGCECVDDIHEYENRRHHGNGQSHRLGLQDEKRLAETCKRKDREKALDEPEMLPREPAARFTETRLTSGRDAEGPSVQ